MSMMDTPTPTPTPTDAPTATPTDVGTPAATEAGTLESTLAVPDRLYQVSTLAPSGPEVAVVYTATAGEMAIFAVLLIILILAAFGLFLEMRTARYLKR